MMIWTTSIDPKTGLARATALPPPVPEEHREFINLHGGLYSPFIPEMNGETTTSADAFLDLFPAYEELNEELVEDIGREWIEKWKTALRWFADNEFDVLWWY